MSIDIITLLLHMWFNFLESPGMSNVFLKEKLDLAFRNKVIEIECRKQEGQYENRNSEKMSKREKGLYNRQLMESIESSTKTKLSVEPRNKSAYVHRAYQIILAEHFKRGNRDSKQNISISIINKMDKTSTREKGVGLQMSNSKNRDVAESNLKNKSYKGKKGKWLTFIILIFKLNRLNTI
jgi:hypothetical protein